MTRRIKVCHITTRFLAGGGTRRITHLLNGLDRKRFDADLIVGRDVCSPQLAKLNAVDVIELDSLVRSINLLLDTKTLIGLYNLLRAQHYDIVHTHHAKAGVLGRFASKLAGIPVLIHTLHGSTFHSSFKPLVRHCNILLERVLGKFTNHYVSVGYDLVNSYLSCGIGEADKYTVIRSGMALCEFFVAGELDASKVQAKREELGLGRSDIVIGMVARFVEGKGHEFAIEAAEAVVRQHPRARFLYIGEGPLQSSYERMVVDKGIGDRIVFGGYREDIAEVISTFDVFLYTSLWEGLAQVLVQAAAVGKPIVTFQVDGAREVVQEGVNGFIVPLKDVRRLVEKLDYLLTDLNRAREMGLKGRKIVEDSWDIDTMVRKTTALYERLLNSPGWSKDHECEP